MAGTPTTPSKIDGLLSGVLKHTIGILVRVMQATQQGNDNLFQQVDAHLDNVEGANIVPYVVGKRLKFKTLPAVTVASNQETT